MRKIKCAAVCALLFAVLCGCGTPAPESVTKSGFYFDTVIQITLYADEQEPLLDGCFEIAKRYEEMFSVSIATSEISRINQAAGKPVKVSSETARLIQKCLEYCKLSEGRFDITIGKLSSLWNFSDESDTLPSEKDIMEAKATVDYRNVVLDGNRVRLKNPDAAIDLGGIAKGYIADRMKEYLEENSVTSGLINLGGNVLCLGTKPDGTDYRIGIQKPFDERGAPAATVDVADRTVVSSGIYERYRNVDGKLYHHILNPDTGRPYENNLLGVTVVCGSSADGDGLSTVCFALGLERGMELIERLESVEAVFITDDFALHGTSGIGEDLQEL